MEIVITSDKYIVSKNEDDSIIHLSFINENATFRTGQPSVEQFDTLEEAIAYIDGIKGEGFTKENFKFYFETPEDINNQ